LAIFGSAVALENLTAVVGARLDHPTGPVIGAAYVFESGPGGWRETQKLLPLVPLSSMRFGSSVGISGDWIAVGADGESFSTGAVYMFLRQGGSFVQVQKLTASDPSGSARFGESLDLHADRLIVGAQFKSNVFGADGAAYVFEKIGSAWVETAKLTASDPVHRAFFGSSVAIRGDLAVCGAQSATGPPVNSGAAYVFERGSASWIEVQKLVPTQGQSGQWTGTAVALTDGFIFVSAPNRVETHSARAPATSSRAREAPGSRARSCEHRTRARVCCSVLEPRSTRRWTVSCWRRPSTPTMAPTPAPPTCSSASPQAGSRWASSLRGMPALGIPSPPASPSPATQR
jgi:hypothetical protein